ncbi:MAG: PAS domain S-box protein, partial [Dehalococcoidales bacterium]|nr:PAS domain S-box protein [Dehalococcoidales bacterium]
MSRTKSPSVGKKDADIDILEKMSLWESIEKKYISSERRYRLLAENITDVIWTLDSELTFSYISPSVFTMRGYSVEEAMMQSLDDAFTPSSVLVIKKVLQEEMDFHQNPEIKNAPGKILELDQLCKNGSIINTETRLTRFYNDETDDFGFIGVTRDVTERKRIAEQLKQSDLLASLGKMTAGIAHEVNNPLGSILLFSEMLTKSHVSSDMKKDLSVIHDEAKRAAKVMSDLLTYSLGCKNKVERVDIISILNKVLDMRLYAETVRNINVSIRLSDDPAYVYGDSSQLIQVFMNILLNAEEALEENNGGTINISIVKTQEWVKVSIADDGLGIPKENLSQIFYPFFSTKRIGQGAGLGLSSCYGIVTSHGGLIRAENNA